MPEQARDLDSRGLADRASGERLRWYLNRLRCMSPAEIVHRLGRALAIEAERRGLVRAAAPPEPDLARAPVRWVAGRIAADIEPYIAAADRVAAGRIAVFALHDLDLGPSPRWNRDPVTGIEAPLSFGKRLDYRDPRLVGDHKHLWEPNRHQHLVTLAQAYALRGDTRYLDALRSQLDGWFSACPYGYGPNWSSALEAALRLINWSITWQLIGGADSQLFATRTGASFRSRWLASIYRHACFVRGYFSLYSSANNHLIGEATGLFVAALTWPYWPQTRRWRAQAAAILEREALAQNAPDGVNREQAVGYQLFEIDLLLLALVAGRAADIALPTVHQRIEAMLAFLASIMDVGGNVPAFGDSDDGIVTRLSQEAGFCPYRSVLAAGAVLFERGDFKRKAKRLDEKTRWLLGADAQQVFAGLSTATARLPVSRAFRDGGYYVLGADFETSREIRLVADAGPLGYRSIAAHGHADALAFTLSIGGEEIFVDPGTYTYRPDGPWRGYFRGTAAHNTVRVDGRDQSEPGGGFMWLDKAQATCSRWETTPDRDVFEGWHDGYMRLPDPVLHHRNIALDKRTGRILIEDRLDAEVEHDVELLFHCSEHCRVHADIGGYLVERGAIRVRLKLPWHPGARSTVHIGQHNPPFGWVSRRFGQRRPAPTIRWTARLAGAVLSTEIHCWAEQTTRASKALAIYSAQAS